VENCIDKLLEVIKVRENHTVGKYQTPDESILRYMDKLEKRYDKAMDAIVDASVVAENGSIAPAKLQYAYLTKIMAILDYQKCQDISFVNNLSDLED